jgi:GTP diphosphokinase / guanosine-3',5'-bis(diphosphate) 3'-diphosphatase
LREADFESLVDAFRATVDAPAAYSALIMATSRSVLSAEGVRLVEQCDKAAEVFHFGQVRGDGSPYIVHPRRVALLASRTCESSMVQEALLVGLLHDVVEDCGVGVDWIRDHYGSIVAGSVAILTAPPEDEETRSERLQRKSSKWRRVAASDRFTIGVHLMDVLDNCISLRMVRPEMPAWQKLPRWIWQTIEYQLPIADQHLPRVSEKLREEIEYQRDRGVEIGSWGDA